MTQLFIKSLGNETLGVLCRPGHLYALRSAAPSWLQVWKSRSDKYLLTRVHHATVGDFLFSLSLDAGERAVSGRSCLGNPRGRALPLPRLSRAGQPPRVAPRTASPQAGRAAPRLARHRQNDLVPEHSDHPCVSGICLEGGPVCPWGQGLPPSGSSSCCCSPEVRCLEPPTPLLLSWLPPPPDALPLTSVWTSSYGTCKRGP